MAWVAQRTSVQQHGDAVVGEQTQVLYDEETGLLGQRRTTVAQVPIQGGGSAVLVRDQMEVGQVVRFYIAIRPTCYMQSTVRACARIDVYLKYIILHITTSSVIHLIGGKL